MNGGRQRGRGRGERGSRNHLTQLSPPPGRPVPGGREGGAWKNLGPGRRGAASRRPARETASAVSGGPRSATAGPDPRLRLRLPAGPRLPHTGGPGQAALRSRGRPGTRSGSPDALPGGSRSASPASLQPDNTARSADSRGAGPLAAAGQ